jgi:hypothetical protein
MCTGAVKTTTEAQQEALDLICNTNYTTIVEELKEDWNWPSIRAEVCQFILADKSKVLLVSV